MANPRYSQDMKDEIKRMVAAGKTQTEIAEHFNLKDRFVVHQILKRERHKETELTALPKKKGRPAKNPPQTISAIQAENKQLKMENELMRSFMEIARRCLQNIWLSNDFAENILSAPCVSFSESLKAGTMPSQNVRREPPEMSHYVSSLSDVRKQPGIPTGIDVFSYGCAQRRV